MRHWLRGGREDQRERIEDLVKFGVGPEEARRFVEAEGEPVKQVFGIWPQNQEGLTVFFRLNRQWRLHPFTGKPIGLDHAAIPPTLQLMGIPPERWPKIFDQLSICEETVLTPAG